MLDNKSVRQMADELGVSIYAVKGFQKAISKTPQNSKNELLRGTIRLEINQENAISELSRQIVQYTENYERAIKLNDEDTAFKWSRNRIDLLEKMLRVTGLNDSGAKNAEQKPIEIIITHVRPPI